MSPLGDALGEAAGFITRYVVFERREAVDFLALWCVHSHAFEAAVTTPYPRITSAEPRWPCLDQPQPSLFQAALGLSVSNQIRRSTPASASSESSR